MIGDIRNPWLRKPLVVLTVLGVCLVWTPFALCGAWYGWINDEFGDEIRSAWRGPK